MRKFNLKGTVIQRMRGIEREEPRTVENEKTQIEETPVMSVDFTEEQGVFACAWRTDVGRLLKNNQFQQSFCYAQLSFLWYTKMPSAEKS